MQRYTLTLICILAAVIVARASASNIQLTIIDETSQPIDQAHVQINELRLYSDSSGQVTLSPPVDTVISVKISKQGYYPRLHTFAADELIAYSKSPLTLPLIQKKANRTLFAFGGDVMLGRRYLKPYFEETVLIDEQNTLDDAKNILRHVKPYLSIADIAAVNLESQLAESKPAERAKKSVTFYSQPELVEALKWAGVDYVTLGNNHTYDYLDEGLTSTLNILDHAQLPYSGAGLTEKAALAPYIMPMHNQTYALLGYVGWQGSSKPQQTANADHGGAAFGSAKNIIDGVTMARKQKQTPIVQYHGSLEYSKEPTGVTEQRLKSAIDAGAALAVAHHPHVTQGIELYNNKLIAYSMGNFVFDQNFSATQQSFMLYVWLDEGQFHRAEIVPIYVKGYIPTPAIKETRVSVMKRLQQLSAKRNTIINDLAGHGVITLNNQKAINLAHHMKLDISVEKNHSISSFAWPLAVKRVELPSQTISYRLGKNLINASDFEQFSAFDIEERGLVFNPNYTKLTSPGYKSSQSFKLQINNNAKVFGMKHFRRVYKPSNPVTLKAHVNAKKGALIKVYWQGRKTRQKLFDAFEHSPKHLIQSLSISANEAWQPIEIDFNSPRIGYRSYRVFIEVEAIGENEGQLLVDNFSVIEWQTAFQQHSSPMHIDEDSKMATFIGFSQYHQNPVSINISK